MKVSDPHTLRIADFLVCALFPLFSQTDTRKCPIRKYTGHKKVSDPHLWTLFALQKRTPQEYRKKTSELLMPELIEKHRRFLPHLQEAGQIISITWRLEGTLPAHIQALIVEMKTIMAQLDNRQTDSLKNQLYEDYLSKLDMYDDQLGRHKPSGIDLSRPDYARVVTSAFHFYANSLYQLYAYCVMPNHIHLLIRPLPQPSGKYPRMSDIVRRLKGYTGFKLNKLADSKTTIWHPDYFDRYVRDTKDLYNLVQYILNNPLKACLATEQNAWPYSYLNPEMEWI